jgi:hypothetical protein
MRRLWVGAPSGALWRLAIYTEAQRHEAAASFGSPVRATESSPGPARSRSSGTAVPPSAALGHGFGRFPPLPPHHPSFGDAGGEARRGGTLPADFRISRFVVHCMLVGTTREFCESKASGPLTLALSPNIQNMLGEREGTGGNADPGRPPRLLPLGAPWARLCRS